MIFLVVHTYGGRIKDSETRNQILFLWRKSQKQKQVKKKGTEKSHEGNTKQALITGSIKRDMLFKILLRTQALAFSCPTHKSQAQNPSRIQLIHPGSEMSTFYIIEQGIKVVSFQNNDKSKKIHHLLPFPLAKFSYSDGKAHCQLHIPQKTSHALHPLQQPSQILA